ncbi:MAG: hypothetical protein D6790_02110 [Caldilineae bacterium]|nr:MAG: hypothetical protein D6790_02110 [Caldilineae bacterium]
METLIVACVQQKMRLPQTLEDHRQDLRRFLRLAVNKQARLVIFPELAGMMVAPPLLAGFQASLLKRADLARRRQTTLWQKLSGSLAGSLARMLQVDLRRLVAGLLELDGAAVWQAYVDVYAGLAKEFDVTLVAPSAYLPDPLDGVIRNLSVVFGPDGAQLGYQAKGVLHPEDEDLAQPGNEWRVIQTDVGRIGLMLGSDMLYPEVGRLLAYQGAEILIGQGAATDRALYEKLRSGMLARMQDNQLFAAISFLVGPNELSLRQRKPFIGKSAILAPQELTPDASGVLVEMSNYRSESVLTAAWDFPALRELWETSDTPVRRRLPMESLGPALAQLYQRMQQLPRPGDQPALPGSVEGASPEHLDLDELPVLASVTERWPLPQSESDATPDQPPERPTEEGSADFLRAAMRSPAPEESDAAGRPATNETDETQEMDALLRPENEDP